MLTTKASSPALLSHLRHELRSQINVIIGYSEMLLEDLEMANDRKNISTLKEIRKFAIEVIFLIKTLLDDEKLELYQSDLARLLIEQNLQIQFQIPTNLIILCCQEIINTSTSKNLILDINKIKQAAQDLLDKIQMTWLIYGNLEAKSA